MTADWDKYLEGIHKEEAAKKAQASGNSFLGIATAQSNRQEAALMDLVASSKQGIQIEKATASETDEEIMKYREWEAKRRNQDREEFEEVRREEQQRWESTNKTNPNPANPQSASAIVAAKITAGATRDAEKAENADRDKAANSENSDRDASRKLQKEEADAEKDQASAWSKMKSFGSGAADKAKNSSTLGFLFGFALAVFCFWMKLKSTNTSLVFMADFIMLVYCYSKFGKSSIYVFLIAFFVPLIAYGIVSGAGVSGAVLGILLIIIMCLHPQIRGYLSQNKGIFVMEIIFIGLAIGAYVTNNLHIGVVLNGLTINENVWYGSLLKSFTNQFLNITWIIYIAVVKNESDKPVPAFIKIVVLMIAFVLVMGGPAQAAGVAIPGVNAPLVTEEGKQQFDEMLANGGDMFKDVPVLDKVYAATAGLFGIITNVPDQAQEMADNIGASAEPAGNERIAGLDLIPSKYDDKDFPPATQIVLNFDIKQASKIQDIVQFKKTECKMDDTGGWKPGSPTVFALYDESTDFSCPAAASAEWKTCPDITTTTACLGFKSHTMAARAVYEMRTRSSYQPIFVDRVKKMAAEEGGKTVLAQCGLQAQAMPIAKYIPSNSPAALGITLNQDTMPVVVGPGMSSTSPPPTLKLWVSLNKVHPGFVNAVNELIVTLPEGLTLNLGTGSSLCDFEPAAGTNAYKIISTRKGEISNADKKTVVSFKCPLNQVDEANERKLIGDALCAPVTITAEAIYDFTIEASTGFVASRPEATI